MYCITTAVTPLTCSANNNLALRSQGQQNLSAHTSNNEHIMSYLTHAARLKSEHMRLFYSHFPKFAVMIFSSSVFFDIQGFICVWYFIPEYNLGCHSVPLYVFHIHLVCVD